MRACPISWQASADPTIGPTRLASSRTTLALSPGNAVALPASAAPTSAIAHRDVHRNFPRALRGNFISHL
jgi:hypothetical protein